MLEYNREIWRSKAISNKYMAIDIADAYGGDKLNYLRIANKTLRRKIIMSKLADAQPIKVTPVKTRPVVIEQEKESTWAVAGFAFAT
jgi:hypothetical protein